MMGFNKIKRELWVHEASWAGFLKQEQILLNANYIQSVACRI